MATKNSKQFFTVKCKIIVPFYGYGTNKQNTKARKQIKQWIKNMLIDECSFIPLHIEEHMEDCTLHTRITING